MIVIGLDQAPNNIGWAYSSDDESARPVWGCRVNGQYGENEAALMRDIKPWLTTFLISCGADAVYFEQILVNVGKFNMRTLHAQFAVTSTIQFACGELGIDCYDVDVSRWRKRFLGRGNAPKWTAANDRTNWLKDSALRACADRGWLTDNHHAAEALGIMEFGLACSSPAYARRTKGQAVRREISSVREDMVA